MTQSEPPLISVCMPVYNAGRYVAEAVESILDQTLGDFEFLIIDDGSTDDSPEVLRRYAGRDPRIRLTSRPNRGLVTTLNELIDRSRGEFLARMDGDDVALPERFARQVEYLRAHPECVLLGSRVQLIDPEGDPLHHWCTMEDHESIDSSYLQGRHVTAMCHPSIMMRRDAVLAVGKYRPFEVIEDIDLFLRLAEYGRIANLPEPLLRYRIHSGNISKAVLYHEAIRRVYVEVVRDARRRRNLPEVPIAPQPGPGAAESRRAELEKWAWWALGSGQVRSARKHARRLLAAAPFSPRSWRVAYCAARGH